MHIIKLALIGLSISPFAISAQVSQKDTIQQPDSAERAQQLETVSVRDRNEANPGYSARRTTSATKTDLPLRDIPQSITVISKSLISDRSLQSMSEIARYIPGVTFGQGEGHRDAPTIRGNASTADFYLDGVRDDAQYLRDTYNVERIEALKGSNALVFGRGGGGGVINRVTKQADWTSARSISAEGGSFDHKRTTVDLGGGVTKSFAARLNAMAENSGSFRAATDLTRRGFSPAVTVVAGGNVLRMGYEYLADDRTVNRGVPSFKGVPSPAPIRTFFGDPDASRSWLYAHSGSLLLERESPGVFTLRNRTIAMKYDKRYQNVLPDAVTADGSQVTLTGYRAQHDRRNIFNQTDIVISSRPSRVKHTVLLGAEFGRQNTDNFRATGFFGSSTAIRVPFGSPTVNSGVVFKQNPTDADNNVRTSVASVYAQEQLEIGRHLQAIAGVRGEQFTITFLNNRVGQKLSSNDVMVSPRIGLNLKPVDKVSLYASMSVSHLPSSGDQFSALTATTSTLEPELFRNSELGFKWDVLPTLSFTSAVYKLDRSNTSAPNPVDPSRLLQTGKQRSSGFEANLAGNFAAHWQVFAGFARQRAEILNRTTSSRAGASVPMVPGHGASLWSRYDVSQRLGFGAGIVAQSRMFAAIDNTVTLPAFKRADAALYFTPMHNLRLQANIENLLNVRYYANSHGNNSIMPGAPRTVRISATAF